MSDHEAAYDAYLERILPLLGSLGPAWMKEKELACRQGFEAGFSAARRQPPGATRFMVLAARDAIHAGHPERVEADEDLLHRFLGDWGYRVNHNVIDRREGK